MSYTDRGARRSPGPAPIPRSGLSRRSLLLAAAGGLGGLTLSACTNPRTPGSVSATAIAEAEARRTHSGRTRAFALKAAPARVDLGGVLVNTWAYDNAVPGSVLRASVGDELAVTVSNLLPEPTSVHWHGIALRNDMDGVSPATRDIPAQSDFTYRFSVPDAGTYWFHPHVGLQADTGLYAPLLIDDPNEPLRYDEEWVVVLDDWLDGTGLSPKSVYEKLRAGSATPMSGMSGMDQGPMGASSGGSLLGNDGGDVAYPHYLVNGRVASAPTVFSAKPGQRVRLRIINAGADTAFRVAVDGHQMQVTHTDGFPVEPTTVDALLVGMGERYDAILVAKDGVFPLMAAAEGKQGFGMAMLRTSPAMATPSGSVPPRELTGRVGTVADFVAASSVLLPNRRPDVTLPVDLGGDMGSYRWTINGRPFEDTEPLQVERGQRVRLTFANRTMMWHPMHLHGHTFQVVGKDGQAGPRKDTVIVTPMQTVAVDLVADNPGRWMVHCHNAYHQEAGMMGRLDYRS